jgi:hypothetical protein
MGFAGGDAASRESKKWKRTRRARPCGQDAPCSGRWSEDQWRGGARPCQLCETLSRAVKAAMASGMNAIAILGNTSPIALGVTNWPPCAIAWQIGQFDESSNGVFFAGAPLFAGFAKNPDASSSMAEGALGLWMWV